MPDQKPLNKVYWVIFKLHEFVKIIYTDKSSLNDISKQCRSIIKYVPIKHVPNKCK